MKIDFLNPTPSCENRFSKLDVKIVSKLDVKIDFLNSMSLASRAALGELDHVMLVKTRVRVGFFVGRQTEGCAFCAPKIRGSMALQEQLCLL